MTTWHRSDCKVCDIAQIRRDCAREKKGKDEREREAGKVFKGL